MARRRCSRSGPAAPLGTLDPGGSPGSFLEWLVESPLPGEMLALMEQGSLPSSPEECFAEVLVEAERGLAAIKSPLEAELWASEMLGILSLSGMDPTLVEDLCAEAIVPMAEEAASPTALAMLAAIGAVGGRQLTAAAGVARQRLAAKGVAQPPWASLVGMPEVRRCWSYRDAFGCQESIYLTFAYGRALHALCVLVDHDLGGGVKDSWVSAKVTTLRRRVHQAAEEDPLGIYEDLDPLEAALRLERAIASPECPQWPDQVEDLSYHRALLRSRVAHVLAVQRASR
jgi:hypothetical protein